MPLISSYIENIKSSQATTPALVDKKSLCSILSGLYQSPFDDIESFQTAGYHSLFFYDIPEEKKHLDIATIKKCQNELHLKPYEGKHIFVFLSFDTAQKATQNACLKFLEECPPYAVILLCVNSTGPILETIHSRTLPLFSSESKNRLDPPDLPLLESYVQGNSVEWIAHLYETPYSKEEALQILIWVYKYVSKAKKAECLHAIEALYSVHENPRNILEAFFLCS